VTADARAEPAAVPRTEERELAVVVSLTPALAPAAEAAALTVRSIKAAVAELADGLGVAVLPQVRLETGGGPLPNGIVALRANGRSCPFPPTVIGEALAYVDGMPSVPAASEVLDRLEVGGDRDARVAELLAHVCRAALSRQPPLLLPATEPPAVRAALDLGMSLAGDNGTADDPARSDGSVEGRLAHLASGTIDIEVHPTYLRLLSDANPSSELLRFTREGLFVELGVPLPDFHYHPDPSLREGGFAFRLNAVRTVPRIGLLPTTILVNDTPDRLALMAVEAEPTLNPATHQPNALAASAQKDALELAGLTTWDPGGYLVLCLAAAVRRNAHFFMTEQVAEAMVGELGSYWPSLVESVRAHVPTDELTPVLRELLRERVSIRNLRRILELLLRYESGVDRRHIMDRVSFVRAGMADAIASGAARGSETVVTYLLDPKIEAELLTYVDSPAEPDDSLRDRVSDAIRTEVAFLPPTALRPAILTQDELRRPLAALLRPEFDELRVLAYSDLPPHQNVQPVARISWD
jgi:hypothetical protein